MINQGGKGPIGKRVLNVLYRQYNDMEKVLRWLYNINQRYMCLKVLTVMNCAYFGPWHFPISY